MAMQPATADNDAVGGSVARTARLASPLQNPYGLRRRYVPEYHGRRLPGRDLVSLKFVCDEGVDRQIVDALRGAGHDVTYLASD